MGKAYYAIIPANVRYDKRLPPNAKLLYGEITALCNEKGFCWASNKYFSELYGVHKDTISSWIQSLAEAGHVLINFKYKYGTNCIDSRCISLPQPIGEITDTYRQNRREGVGENPETPIGEITEENTTVLNITDDEVCIPELKEGEVAKETPKRKKPFVKPTLEEVAAYCKERDKGVNPKKWFNHYTANGWKVGKNPMQNWKAAVRTWEPDEKEEGQRDYGEGVQTWT